MTKRILCSVLIIFLLATITLLSMVWRSEEKGGMRLSPVAFQQLPGWNKANLLKSFHVFQKSCKSLLKQKDAAEVGSRYLPMQAEDWKDVCQAAVNFHAKSREAARQFFQNEFLALSFVEQKPVKGLFTGYYSPLLRGSLEQTKQYQWPLYGLPSDLVKVNLNLFRKDLLHARVSGRVQAHQLVPYHSRKAINQGAIKDKSEVIVWLDDPIDRQFLEIQGSGMIELPDGERFFVGYAGENGLAFTPIARVLIDKGVMTKDNASMQGIKKYLEAHPEEKSAVLEQNQSFVFFEKQNINEAFGAQGLPLTAGYSLAVDRKWIPLGAPLWLDTTHPSDDGLRDLPLHRLMIAQDTGGAIRGPVRGDVYWGAGDQAQAIAGRMKNTGHYWLLLPKNKAQQLLEKQAFLPAA